VESVVQSDILISRRDFPMADQTRLIAAISHVVGEVRQRKGRLDEANTKKSLIEPVLQALGWEVHSQNHILYEYKKDRKDKPLTMP
jgi:hypothetical protein